MRSALALFIFAATALAHDIPNDVTVQAYLKPEGDRVLLLVRAPMSAMQEIEFPQRGPGYLDFDRADRFLQDAAVLWISGAIQLYEDGAPLPKPRLAAARASLESDRSFSSFKAALAHMSAPKLTNETAVVWSQTALDALFEYPIRSERSRFAIHPGLDRLGVRVVTTLRFLPAGANGAVRAFEFNGDPGLVRLDPRWHQAAARFVREGFQHILSGTDHLLFLCGLVIPFRRLRALIPIVTAFTAGHSTTLIASAYHLAPDALWFPPLIETLIAASIVYMALENIVGAASVQRRWAIAFGFGLVHGFGFSFALRETLQFAGSYLLTSLLSFNVGVELGQLLVLTLLVGALEFLFRFGLPERMGTILLSAFVAHTGWHWVLDRADRLMQFRFQWPEINALFLAGLLRWLMGIVALAGLAWLVAALLKGREALKWRESFWAQSTMGNSTKNLWPSKSPTASCQTRARWPESFRCWVNSHRARWR
ncbi:MAG TPA: HupE/UreJ family protein [Bryobacteraceae bacterium]|nr:HupE/UreJ family protein [Bryobacteraceae bacterium]